MVSWGLSSQNVARGDWPETHHVTVILMVKQMCGRGEGLEQTPEITAVLL